MKINKMIYLITAHHIEDTLWARAFSSIEKCNEFLHKNYNTHGDFLPLKNINERQDIGVKVEWGGGWDLWLNLSMSEIDSMENPYEDC